MSEKFDKEYEIEQVGEEATYLRNNGKVREVFALAAAGAIATIEVSTIPPLQNFWPGICIDSGALPATG